MSILSEVTDQLKRDYSLGANPLQLQFSGLGHFGDAVVFVKVRDGPAKDKLHEMAGTVNNSSVSSKNFTS